MTKTSCGLDFGTANSGIGTVKDGNVAIVELEPGKDTAPTTLFFGADKKIRFGSEAVMQMVSREPGRFMRGLKSILGHAALKETRTLINGQIYDLTDLIGIYIKHLKTKAEQSLDKPLENVVLGRPVHFVDDNPAKDSVAQTIYEKIAQKQGFKNIVFQYEPIAVALNYEQQVDRETIVFVADIGGGTSDFSVVRVYPNGCNVADRNKDILANDSVHVAGTNLDGELSFHHVMPLLGRDTTYTERRLSMPVSHFRSLSIWERVPELYKDRESIRSLYRGAADSEIYGRLLKIAEEETGHLLCMNVEKAKIALTDNDKALISLEVAEPGLKMEVSKAQFNEYIAPKVERITDKAKEVLSASGLKAEQVDKILLTGGSSMVPEIRNGVLNMFPGKSAEKLNLFSATVRGLAIDAKSKFK